jgi:inositol-pentakisphosphate 2-kinase
MNDSLLVHTEAITIESHWLESVLQQVEKDRPIHRKIGLDMDLTSPIAYLQPDASLIPGVTMKDSLAIEIKVLLFDSQFKPKWGFLPKESFYQCRYCLHQRYKYSKGTLSSISSYCPLDLYSGDASRMKRALKYLSECNQNNFRCFINGKMVDFYSVSDK